MDRAERPTGEEGAVPMNPGHAQSRVPCWQGEQTGRLPSPSHNGQKSHMLEELLGHPHFTRRLLHSVLEEMSLACQL
jgi:hypothetical protein